MKTAELHFWCRTKGDRRDEASDVGTIEVPQTEALRIAREIEEDGVYMADKGNQGIAIQARSAHGNPAATGHGVTIAYASGRNREVQGDN